MEKTYNKQLFNSKAIAILKEQKFSGVFHNYDVSNTEKIIKCKLPPFVRKHFKDEEGNIPMEAFLKGYELKDNVNKKTYLIPSTVKKGEEYIPITDLFPIKIKGSFEVYHGKNVYHWVSADNIKSVSFPESDELPMKDFIDGWLDIEHNNPDDLFVAKVVMLASHFGGFSRIIGDKGFLKDGLVNALIGITGIGNNISKVASDAKWVKLIDDKYTVFNELSGFSGERLELAQNFFLGTGDVNTDTYNHSTLGLTGDKRQ